MPSVGGAPDVGVKSVLIAYDFSEASHMPLRHVLTTARHFGAKFYLAHVVSSVGLTIAGPEASKLATEGAQRDAQKLEQELLESGALTGLAEDLNVMLQHYIRAKVILGGLSFILYSTAMIVLGFPHAIALGLLGGILESIPVAGWMISAATIISVGALTHSRWIWMASLLGAWRMLGAGLSSSDHIPSAHLPSFQLPRPTD